MPELPEVEVVRLQLDKHLPGKKISGVEVLDGKAVAHDKAAEKKLVGLALGRVMRKGKLLVIATDQSDVWLLAHLKMTGQLIFVAPKGAMAGGGHTLSPSDIDLPHRHTRLVLSFKDGSKLYFNDLRKFGYVKVVGTKTKDAELAKYGREPIAPDFTFAYFDQVLGQRKTSIKAFLLAQQHIAGLGNIYVDEACFRAEVRPDRIVHTLTAKERQALHASCREVLQESIAVGGTTFYSFKDADGGEGGFSKQLQVFQREGLACYRCGSEIVKTKHAGRGTHYCPGCQR